MRLATLDGASWAAEPLAVWPTGVQVPPLSIGAIHSRSKALSDAISRLGTGGLVRVWLPIAFQQTPTSSVVVWREDSPVATLTPSSMLTRVRSRLSLTMVETASVLQVERPTVYAWLAGRAEPQPRNRHRIERLYELSNAWARLTSRPLGDLVRTQGEGGFSLVELLQADRYEEAAARLERLASQTEDSPSARRVAEMDRLLKKLRLTGRTAEQSAEIDRITRRPLGSDD